MIRKHSEIRCKMHVFQSKRSDQDTISAGFKEAQSLRKGRWEGGGQIIIIAICKVGPYTFLTD